MAKAKEMENTETKTERTKIGTSLQARAKSAILSLSVTLKEYAQALADAGIILPEAGEIFELATEFAKKSTKGLPLARQLENTVAAMREILQAADTSSGLVVFTEEQETAYENLATKAKRLRAAIAKEKQETADNPAE